MDVYLLPVGPDRYELYCEHTVDQSVIAEAPEGSGRFARILHRFNAAVARVEQEQQNAAAAPVEEAVGWRERMKRRMLCWIAEKMAEQRLLWRIRKESDVALFFPDDIGAEVADSTWRRMIRREADRHLKWAIIDGVLFCVSGVVALVPGPNPVAYYFGFRFLGHFLSRRGATHALKEVRWQYEARAELTQLRRAVPLDAPERERQVSEVAAALNLQHLATFFERTAIPAA